MATDRIKVGNVSIEELERRVNDLREKRSKVDDRLQEAMAKLAMARMSEYPQEPGWYLDAQGRIAELVQYDSGPAWQDGWGNEWDGNGGIQLPELPMVKLRKDDE